jgi:hypothetical protein
MRTRLVELMATAIALVASSCRFPSTSSPTCDEDIDLCPKSERTATSVTCDCHCTIGGGENPANNFDGAIAMCLPPALNTITANDEQRVALDAMEQRAFNQRVYQYCSGSVAGFVRIAIKAHANLKLAACVMPVRCECKTAGTHRDSFSCHSTCADRPCDAKNCTSILRRESKLDIAACSCSRGTVCGESAPPTEDDGVCRDWLTFAH